MACESCLQIIQPTVQPTCMQIVQAVPTIVPPDSINVLVGGVQQVTYWSDIAFYWHGIYGLICGIVISVCIGLLIGISASD